jgi:hypothetical protein
MAWLLFAKWPRIYSPLLQLALEFVEKATKDAIDAMVHVKFIEGKKYDS